MLTPKRSRIQTLILKQRLSTADSRETPNNGYGTVLTVVAFSISPVVPEVGVLLEVLPYTSSPHPCTLQDPNLIKINIFWIYFEQSTSARAYIEVCGEQIIRLCKHVGGRRPLRVGS